MASGHALVCLTFDWDGETMWVGPGKAYSPSLESRGRYAYRVAVPRILDLLKEEGIKSSFYIPGYTAHLHPDMVRRIYEEGHEIGAHNYYHEKPLGSTESEERWYFEESIKVLSGITGERPKGWRCPAWLTTKTTYELLPEYGFLYDSSLMDEEVPYILETEGKTGKMVEIPVAWELDDAPYFLFAFYPSYEAGMSSPQKVLDIWKAEFDYAWEHRHFFCLTCHPQVIGHPHRFAVLQAMIKHMKEKGGVTFARMDEVAAKTLTGDLKFI